MTHTPFVSNPCPATAIVFVSQNLFYGQLPQALLFFFWTHSTQCSQYYLGTMDEVEDQFFRNIKNIEVSGTLSREIRDTNGLA